MCASLRPFQNCHQIVSSVNIKIVMMILVFFKFNTLLVLWPYIRFVPKIKKKKYTKCHISANKPYI